MKKILQVTHKEGSGHWLMEAMFRNQYVDILQNQAESTTWEKKKPKYSLRKMKHKPISKVETKMENNFQISNKRLGEFCGIKRRLQCSCKIRKTISRLYSELKTRRHGGNYFDKLGTGKASGRILCLSLYFICIFTDPLKMNLKRGKMTHKLLRKCNQWRMIERIGFFTGIDKAEKHNKMFAESGYRVKSCLQGGLEERQERQG